jgi:glycosyltransferase involved in cell wall biosynthesis
MVFVGDGPLRPELEHLAETSTHGVLHMVGPTRDVRPLLAAADFFVLPSWREGLSFSLLEAMSLGLTPVVSDAPGNVEAVGDAGIVVARGDVDGFAAAFRRLMTSEAERIALGGQARARVAAQFSTEQMVRQSRELYDEVLGLVRAP